MQEAVDLSLSRRETALLAWAEDCGRRMSKKWPGIDFSSASWPLRTTHGAEMEDLSFATTVAAFAGKDPAYCLAARCLMAEVALTNKVKIGWKVLRAWLLLAALDVPLAALRRLDICSVEEAAAKHATDRSAGTDLARLQTLGRQLDDMGRKGVIDRIGWTVSPDTKTSLLERYNNNRANFKLAKGATLDRKIEALSDATRAMLRGDRRLSTEDCASLAIANITMCAPSRINEPLTLGIDDRFTIEDYATRSAHRERDVLHSVHQLLLIKGSKGADWGAKPILNFMIDLVDHCWKRLLELGARSRKLVSWYEQNPHSLFLPPELQHLRGVDISRAALWQIVNLTSASPPEGITASINDLWKEFHKAGKVRKIPNPNPIRADGGVALAKHIQVIAWDELQPLMLSRVKSRLQAVRQVTPQIRYEGKLSNMLVLFDRRAAPWLPDSVKYHSHLLRLKRTAARKATTQPTVFEKLDIQMVEDGRVIHAYLETHDPRRWLTTMALKAKERLPDVLLNKWARRLKLSQLDSYDVNPADVKASQSAMPEVEELADMTAGLRQLESLEAQYGLESEVVVANDAGIAVTSMEAVFQATENRPVARTSNQIIILYPTRFGVCLHQHHVAPCRSYRMCGSGCNEQVVVKGHLPSNEQWRRTDDLAQQSIINQLQALITARNYELADDQDAFDLHLLTLVGKGLDATQMCKEMLDRFHELKDQIQDIAFRKKLHDAFVARGIVEQLDSSKVHSGALIKYHDPSRHAAPGHERAIEAQFGSRASMAALIEKAHETHPEFAPRPLGLEDQGHLLTGGHDEGEEDDAKG
ncbi:MAG: hypothetical protein KA766_01365 [Piscinibacter sp.]|uniref:hypothetical protein n=1 Tax=Piscinibacter sp. TaxID=1903157 RepID=UPI001B3D5F2B|nr:hypothetical protein [Piscinibacter sp.]MBP5988649.1 hypothetical protein [Piscinibacter sp.]MBP6025862.1 hypothetical protein [Piscinibacter sp.]